MTYKPFCDVEIIFSNKEELIEKLISLDTINILLVMSESSSLRWHMADFIKKLETKCQSAGGDFTWIKALASNPTQQDIIKSLKQIGDKKVEAIIAFGGGSAIDLAKAISAFYDKNKNKNYTSGEITKIIKNRAYTKNKAIDIIAIPTTAGTGTEFTQWATIWDENKGGKFSVDHPTLKPRLAILSYDLTITMPAAMTLATGLDAMCQAIESYWSRHTTPMVQEIAYRSVELTIENLRQAVDYPEDAKAREKLCSASVLSGLAFSQTRTTACHSISYPLTMLYDIPHGLAASITLDAVGKINRGHFANDDALFGLFDQYGGIMNWIDLVCDGVIEMRLSAFGIKEKDIDLIVNKAFTEGRMDNNPADLTRDQVQSILKSIM